MHLSNDSWLKKDWSPCYAVRANKKSPAQRTDTKYVVGASKEGKIYAELGGREGKIGLTVSAANTYVYAHPQRDICNISQHRKVKQAEQEPQSSSVAMRHCSGHSYREA
jgi:hypothetical protein